MSAASFRRIALSMPEAVEREHMDHPDFRVGGKIFATLYRRGEEFGVVKLTPVQQARFVKAGGGVFEPVPGGWGRRGYTRVRLAGARVQELRRAIEAAWRNTAPNAIVRERRTAIRQATDARGRGNVPPGTRRRHPRV